MQHLSENLRGTSVLITGGNGYIGRITTIMLEQWGCTVWCLDDLSGSQAPTDTTRFIHGSILDTALLSTLFQQHQFDVVIHLKNDVLFSVVRGSKALVRQYILAYFRVGCNSAVKDMLISH